MYGDDAERTWFTAAWQATGRKLDMGKFCVRFKRADDVDFAVLGQAAARVSPERLIAAHGAAHGSRR